MVPGSTTSRAAHTRFLAGQPHNSDAEQSLLGALFIDPERLLDVITLVTADDFYDPIHRRIYATLCTLHESHRKIDFVTVADALRGDPALEAIGGSAYLATLSNSVPTSSHATEYAGIIRDKALHRKLLNVGERIQALGKDEGVSGEDALGMAENLLLQTSRHSSVDKPQHIAEVGAESYERYTHVFNAKDKTALFGLTTGFQRLDDMLTGLPAGHLMIVAARPSMGKSAFALDIARHVASSQQMNVAIFSLEMSKQEIMDRVIAGYLGVQTWKLKKGELTQQDFERMGTLFDQLKKHPIYIDDDADTTLQNLRSKARRLQMEHGLDLLIIDYLQLIEVTDKAAGENRTQQVSHISRQLKNLARELQAPIIALSQLSRTVEQRSPPIPVLSDLRESGSIEQDADSVLMLYRQSMYDEDCDNPTLTDVYLRKNRHGPTGRIELQFNAAKMSFAA
ncbi:MAG TPA: replicative DNA helicase [Gemmatales bacterium]|nr:replicative DNA helicase [Gemmatales bacterium]